jgi:3-oxoacyl-[acyl-carrier-protein] synthase-3
MGIMAAHNALYGKPTPDILIATTSYPTGHQISRTIAQELYTEDNHPTLALDIYAACSGFAEALYHLKEHEDFFEGKNVAIVSTELYSPTLIDPEVPNARDIDPSRAKYLFSDGAVATNFTYGKDLKILAAEHGEIPIPEGEENPLRMPIRRDLIKNLPAHIHRPVPYSHSGYFEQNGRMVLKTVGNTVPELVNGVVAKADLEMADIDYVVPHQGSGRIVDIIAKKLEGMCVVKDVAQGNFSSASIPKALERAIREGKISKGDRSVLAGFGAGLYGSVSVVEF